MSDLQFEFQYSPIDATLTTTCQGFMHEQLRQHYSISLGVVVADLDTTYSTKSITRSRINLKLEDDLEKIFIYVL